MKRLLLIDALNLIRRIYAVNETHEANDASIAVKNTCNAVQSAIKSLCKTHKPSHAVAVFDGDKSWRYHFYPQYKSSRKPMPENLKLSLSEFDGVIAKAGIKSFHPENDEADDVIATLATKAAASNVNVVIVSTDKGFLPLLSEKITVYDHFNRTSKTEQDVIDKYGVGCLELTRYWALCGDKTNDIPGVRGIGAKTACKLVKEHDSLTNMLASIAVKPAIKEKLQLGLDDYILSEALVTLRKDIELGFSMKDIRLIK
ncbi:flap endonuclease Xni (plasmid) [Pseudoalteromonas sp. T1lg65]|uniref:flap endonuclease Xni n=1 Tax=Pseudoalteromonas sp. T1lg65 TaxID=2077101 RepID=UPI003F79817E